MTAGDGHWSSCKAPVTWVEPELVCEVRFTAWTGGHLRHPIFVGMREDKPARSVRRETPGQTARSR
jgi:ATP-dependent DNA ligase